MAWIGVGMAAVGAVSGARTASSNRKKQRQQDAFRKKAITYSPWTGMEDPGAGNFGNQDAFSGMLGGAAQGYALGSGIGGAFKGAPTPIEGAQNFQTGQNVLGSTGLNTQLADQFSGQGSGIQAAQNALGDQGNMWDKMAGSAGAYGSSMTDKVMQQPSLGSGMLGMNNQMQGLNPMNQFGRKSMLGANYGG